MGDDFTKVCPTFAMLMTVDEFKTAATDPVSDLPVEPAKPQLTKKQALDLVDYFAHISCNPCPPKYCGVNVDVAADRLGLPRPYVRQLYDEYQQGRSAIAVATAPELADEISFDDKPLGVK